MVNHQKNGHLTSHTNNNLKVINEGHITPELLAKIWAERARTLAQPPSHTATGETLDILIFSLDDEQYALEVTYIQEIYPLEKITPVPRTPAFVVGVFSARGRLISVIDLHAFLDLPPLNPTAESKIIVIVLNDLEVGLLTDKVTDVITILKDDLVQSGVAQGGNRADFTMGIAPGMIMVLDLNLLVKQERLIIQEELI